jgi:iron(III) transport system permease protein
VTSSTWEGARLALAKRHVRWRTRTVAMGLTVACLAFAILYPLGRILYLAFTSHGRFTVANLTGTLTAGYFLDALRTTAISVLAATAIAVVAGSFLAWANLRTDASLGWFGQIFPIVPVVIPHIAMASGWVLLATPRAGLLSAQLEKIPVIKSLIPSIFSMEGLVFVLGLTLVPYVFLVVQTSFRNLDPALEEASLSAGSGVLRTLVKVSLPAMRQAITGAALLAIIVGTSEYAVPLLIGSPEKNDTLSVYALRFLTAEFPIRLTDAAMLGVIMLVITACIWALYFKVTKAGRFAQISSRSATSGVISLGRWRWPARAIMLGFFVLTCVLPLGALLVVTFQPYWSPNIDVSRFTLSNIKTVFSSPQLAPALSNSARFAAVGALVAVLIVMYLTSASKVAGHRIGDVGLAVVKIPAAIASLVLGIGFVIAFYGKPFYLGGSAVLLVGAYIVIFLPHASILGESATAQVPRQLIEASQVSRASWLRTQLRIMTPLTAQGFVAAYALLFAMMAGEASVSRILAAPGTVVLGFSILQLYDFGGIGQVAVLATALACLNLLVVGGLISLSQVLRRRW